MNKSQGIIVFGANGSGKTTLGRELALAFNYKHMDIEDYYFEKSDIPYTKARSLDFIDAWADTLVCPVLRIDGTKPIAHLVKEIGEHIK